MLTGRAPYQADTPMGLIMAHISKPIPDIRALHSDMPDEVQEIIQGAMAKDPADRYQSAGALAADLTRAPNAPSRWIKWRTMILMQSWRVRVDGQPYLITRTGHGYTASISHIMGASPSGFFKAQYLC